MDEIKDTEIRIIGQSMPYKPQPVRLPAEGSRPIIDDDRPYRSVAFSVREPRVSWKWILSIIVLLIGFASLIYWWRADGDEIKDIDAEKIETIQESCLQLNSTYEASSITDKNNSNSNKKLLKGNYCNISRIIVNDVPMKIFNPGNAVPKFRVGKIETADPQIVLACQAADIREDNGGIVGSCINNGTIIGKGLSKVGFVAFINGKIKIGADLNSPFFEEAIQSNGSFFRQYALVKDGLIIDNRLNNKSIRRAICELNGRIVVAETESRESFHDFSQALIDYGVQNAVYLVGSTNAYGFCRQNSETITDWGDHSVNNQKNVTYVIWETNK